MDILVGRYLALPLLLIAREPVPSRCLPKFRTTIFLFLFLCWLLPIIPTQGQAPRALKDSVASSVNRNRLIGLGVGFGTVYVGGMVALHHAWYKHAPRTGFHFHNDNRHWNQMDKAGHGFAAFHQSRLGVDALQWAGVSDRKSILYGSLLGIILQTPIEIFDGYGQEYGASVGDALANTFGSATVLAQHLAWGELRLTPKFSFRPSPYAPVRVEMFGETYLEQMLKDYNGQTYWLSADVGAFLPETSRYPRWLNVALGYGANGMVYGDPVQNRLMGYDATRQYYLSLDLNLMNIPTRSKVLKRVFYVASIFRLPAPALEFNRQQKFRFHPLFF